MSLRAHPVSSTVSSHALPVPSYSPSIAPSPISAALLVGGMSRRMGRDKAFMNWHGTPLWKLQLAKLHALSPASLILSAREDQQFPEVQALRINDPITDQGPIPAIQRCLSATHNPLLVLAVDLPHMPVEFLCHLVESQRTHPEQGIVCQNGDYFEPLCAIYPQSILSLLPQHPRLQTLIRHGIEQNLMRTLQLPPPQQTYFLNLNTPADFS